MIALAIILAVYIDPVGPVTEEPWDYLCPIEMIDTISMEELERRLRRQEIREYYRYLQEAGK